MTQRATGDAGGSFAASEEALHQEAREREGSDDFGDPSYLEGLRVLLRAFDAEARFNDYGRVAARANLVNLLGRRLHAEAMWRQRPELLAHEIQRPIVICGLIRPGSTALHYLLGRDPGLQSLEYWLAESPQPRPPREEWDAHPDFRASVAEIEAMYAADPSLKAIHFMMADGPEECRHLMAQHPPPLPKSSHRPRRDPHGFGRLSSSVPWLLWDASSLASADSALAMHA